MTRLPWLAWIGTVCLAAATPAAAGYQVVAEAGVTAASICSGPARARRGAGHQRIGHRVPERLGRSVRRSHHRVAGRLRLRRLDAAGPHLHRGAERVLRRGPLPGAARARRPALPARRRVRSRRLYLWRRGPDRDHLLFTARCVLTDTGTQQQYDGLIIDTSPTSGLRTISGTLTITPPDSAMNVSMRLYAPGITEGAVNFLNTGRLWLEVPPGVTYTSDSGVFQAPEPGGAAIGAAAALSLAFARGLRWSGRAGSRSRACRVG